MNRVLRNSKKSSILACGNTHESVSMKALFEFDNLFLAHIIFHYRGNLQGISCTATLGR